VLKTKSYIEDLKLEPNAPESDNPSGLYCPSCRASGFSHCSDVEHCGGMKLMKLKKE
jgi:hypothetical protein